MMDCKTMQKKERGLIDYRFDQSNKVLITK